MEKETDVEFQKIRERVMRCERLTALETQRLLSLAEAGRQQTRYVIVAEGEGAQAKLIGDDIFQEVHDFMCVCKEPWELCKTEFVKDDVCEIGVDDNWATDEDGQPVSISWRAETSKVSLYRLAAPPSAPVLPELNSVTMIYEESLSVWTCTICETSATTEEELHQHICLPEGQPQKAEITRFEEFDDPDHPFRIWWEKHGQFMLSGGSRRESIWAARGWIAREQMKCGVEVTGDSLHEKRQIRGTSGEGQTFSHDSISREMFDCGYDNLSRAASRRIVDQRYEQLLRAARAARPTETTQEEK